MLPALNEIRMTLVSESLLIASRETCRFASTMEPSSAGQREGRSVREEREGENRREGDRELTSNKLVTVSTKEGFDDVEHGSELRGSKRERRTSKFDERLKLSIEEIKLTCEKTVGRQKKTIESLESVRISLLPTSLAQTH